jgi:hypothetical protein
VSSATDTFNMHVSIMDVATGQATDFGPTNDSITGIAISPDRTTIAYTSPQAVVLMNSDGSNRHSISAVIPVDDPALDTPMWSADGKTIILGMGEFSNGGGGGSTIGEIAVGGSTNAPVVPINAFIADGACQLTTGPSFAPDGSFLVAVRTNCLQSANEGLWAYNLDGTGGQLVATADLAITHPTVLDGTHALVPGIVGNTNQQGLVLVTLGQPAQMLPPPTGFVINDLTISHDGVTAVVAMTNNSTFKTDLFVTTDFQSYTPLTQNGGNHNPAF